MASSEIVLLEASRGRSLMRVALPLLASLMVPFFVAGDSSSADLPPTHYRSSRLVCGWLPYWTNQNGAGPGWKSVEAHADQLDEVSFFAWEADPATGDLSLQSPNMNLGAIDREIDWLHSRDVSPLFTVSLFKGVHDILNNPDALATLTAQIIATTKQQSFDGVDIDFEEFGGTDPTDAGKYTAFLDNLAKQMHGQLDGNGYPKQVIATILGRTQRGSFNFTDEAAIAASNVDRVRVMAYDDYWPGSPFAGAGAPMAWQQQVEGYIKAQVGASESKFILGMPAYAYRWPIESAAIRKTLAHGRSVTFASATSLMAQHNVPMQWDETSETPYFMYNDPGDDATNTAPSTWIAYYENTRSWKYKLDNVLLPSQMGGISEWALGFEDPATWPLLRHTLATPYPVYGAIGQCYARYGGGATFGKPLGAVVPTGAKQQSSPYGRAEIVQHFEHGDIHYKWGDWRADYVLR